MKRLRRIGFVLAGGLALALTAGLAWWSLSGERFLYDLILPDAAQLLEDQDVPTELSAEAFLDDLEFVRWELPRLHVEFERAFDGGRLELRLRELEAAAANLTSDRRKLELVGLFAAGGVGTGHTMVIPFQRALGWRIYPLSTYWFDDGLYVTAAESGHEDSIGQRVLSLGGLPTEQALERFLPYVPGDNERSRRGNVPRLLMMAEPVIALGLAAADGTLELELEDGSRRLVEPAGMASWRGLRWARQTQSAVDDAWSPADLRPRKQAYGLEFRSEGGVLYLEFNQVRNQGEESVAELAERLDRLARREPVERLIIDLRSNEGGNNELAAPLVETISGHPVLDRPGSLYVLIGRRTFSAAANFACALERRTHALFVGERSGFAPDHFGDSVSLLLPGSKIVARVATRFWREDLPGMDREAIDPAIVVPALARHHFEDDDEAYRAAVRHAVPSPIQADRRLPPGDLGTYSLTPHHRAILSAGDAVDRLTIETVGTYLATDLVADREGSFRSPTLELRLVATPKGALELQWSGAALPLDPLAGDPLPPMDLLRSGRFEAGVAAFRAAGRQPALGSDFELAINRIAYGKLRERRADTAVLLFTLNSDLFPHSPDVWDSLGDGLRGAARREEAIASYRRALSIDPLYRNSLRQLAALQEERRR